MESCIICLDDLVDNELAQARICGFCSKKICRSCMANLTEIGHDGEADDENGDLRCPNCRGSLMEGDLHKRREAITICASPSVPTQTVLDLVTLEDLIARVMQLCAHQDTGIDYYNVTPEEVVQAIAHDPEYSSMLERLLDPRRARHLRLSVRRSPADKSNATMLCKVYVQKLTQAFGLSKEHARRILEEVAQQSLGNDPNFERYLAAWKQKDKEGVVQQQPSAPPLALAGGRAGGESKAKAPGNRKRTRS